MKKLSLFIAVIMMLVSISMPGYAAGHNAYDGMRGIDRDHCSVEVTEKGDSLHSSALKNGAYVLYKSVNFGANGAFRADVRMCALMDTSTYMGGTLEIRLDDQYGEAIASYTTDSITMKTYNCELAKTITGIHDVYIVFLNKPIQFERVEFKEYAKDGNEYASYSEPDYLKDIQDTGNKSLIYTMIELGLIEPFMPDEYNVYIGITRGEYATVIAKILGFSGQSGNDSGFLDVSSDSEYAGAVAYLKQNGVVYGSGNSNFNPNMYITATDALTMALRALGYESVVQLKGKGYPQGYIEEAISVGLTKGVDIADALTRGDLATLVDNIINADYLKTTGVSGSVEKKEKIKGIMSKTRDIYKGSGMVAASSMSTLIAPVEAIKDGMVQIGDETFYVGNTYAAALLGYDVTYYYHEEDDVKTLISVSPDDNIEVTTADTFVGDEVYELTENRFSYFSSNKNKNISKNLDADVHILYNGKAIDDSLENLLENGEFCGRVRLVEGKTATTLIIEEYISVWAKDVKVNQNKVFNGLTEQNMLFDNEKDNIAYFYGGAPISFKTIADNSVLMVYKSKNKTGSKLIRVNVSTKSKTGTITGTADNNKIYIDGVLYKKSKQATESFEPGMQGSFLLNDYGEVVAYTKEEIKGEFRVGVFVSAQIIPDLDDALRIKIFEDSDEFGIYFGADTITIDGIKLKNQNDILDGNAEFTGIDNMPISNTLVRYKVNSEGEINFIDTYLTIGGGSDDTFTRLTEPDTAFRFNGTSKLFTKADGGTQYAIAPYAAVPELFGFKTANDADTLFYGSKLTDYKSASYSWNTESMTGEIYCLDRDNPIVSHIIWQSAGGGTNWGYPIIVSEKITTLVDGETAIMIKGFRNSEECSFYVKQTEYNENSAEMVNVRKILDYIQPGDAIRTVASDDGEIANCELLFLANGAETSGGGISVIPNKNNGFGELNSVSRLRATIFGEVTAIMDSFIQVEFAPGIYEYVQTTSNCMRYTYENNKSIIEYNLPIDEISVGDKVLYLAVDYKTRVLCIYEHPDLQ